MSPVRQMTEREELEVRFRHTLGVHGIGVAGFWIDEGGKVFVLRLNTEPAISATIDVADVYRDGVDKTVVKTIQRMRPELERILEKHEETENDA